MASGSFLANKFPTFIELQSRLDKHICVFYLRKEKRWCKHNTNKGDWDETERIYDRLKYQEISHTDLVKLAKLCCCTRSKHRTKLEDAGLLNNLVERWRNELIDFRTREDISILEQDASLAEESDSAATPVSLSRVAAIPLQHRYTLRSRTNTESSEVVVSGESLTTHDRPEFRPHLKTPNETVATALHKKLTPNDFHTGALYIFSRDKSPGFVKIGLSKVSVRQRIKEWERVCGHKVRLLASFEDVPYIHKVERLVHFELAKHWRTEVWCDRCDKQHKEWFEVDVEVAYDVAAGWCNWVKSAQPFAADGRLTETWYSNVRNLESKPEPITSAALMAQGSRSDDPLLRADSEDETTPQPTVSTTPEPIAVFGPVSSNAPEPSYVHGPESAAILSRAIRTLSWRLSELESYAQPQMPGAWPISRPLTRQPTAMSISVQA